MVTLEVARVTRQERAEKFVEAIQGKSYFNFQVYLCPANGETAVTVETQETDNLEDAKDMLMYLMFLAMTK